MRTLNTICAIILLLLASAAAIAALDGCKNEPHPITPEPGLPCGRLYYTCQDGCCYHTDICRPGGWCAFGGLEPNTWGAARDGGGGERVYKALPPEQARKAAPR